MCKHLAVLRLIPLADFERVGQSKFADNCVKVERFTFLEDFLEMYYESNFMDRWSKVLRRFNIVYSIVKEITDICIPASKL